MILFQKNILIFNDNVKCRNTIKKINYAIIKLTNQRNKLNLFSFPEFSRRIVYAGPCGPVRPGSGAAGISAGVCGGEAAPSAIHHHLRGQSHQGNAPTGKCHGNEHKRGT